MAARQRARSSPSEEGSGRSDAPRGGRSDCLTSATVPVVCKKWGITVGTLRRWKREHRFEYLRGDLRELVLVALCSSTVRDPADLVSFLDMQDHTIHSPKEIGDTLDALVVEGKALKRDGVWSYDETRLARERPFLF